jgi:hypothetical protein
MTYNHVTPITWQPPPCVSVFFHIRTPVTLDHMESKPFVLFFAILGIELSASSLLGNHSTTSFCFLFVFQIGSCANFAQPGLQPCSFLIFLPLSWVNGTVDMYHYARLDSLLWPYLNLMVSAKTLFPNMVTCMGSGYIFWGDITTYNTEYPKYSEIFHSLLLFPRTHGWSGIIVSF